ncbi:MAG: PQQ-binding-like beta-propeller repeat protein [Chitinophagales bacterium]|nr:PQQ-binding-like beta-propeller repeat protein [Chitinophagales bacterium]
MRNVILFSALIALIASCAKPEFSTDEPLIPAKRPALYITSQSNVLYALNPATGAHIWEKDFGTNLITQEPVVEDGTALVRTDMGIVVMDADKGTISDTIREFFIDDANRTINGAISVKGGLCYTSTAGGYVIVFDYKTKVIVKSTVKYGDPISSSGVFYNDQFIFTIQDKVYMVNQNDISILAWSFTASGNASNPTVGGGSLYVTGSARLHCVDLLTGLEIWNFNPPGGGVGYDAAPIYYGGNIIYPFGNTMYCIDSVAHAPRWVYKTDERLAGAAYAYDNTIYFGSFDNYVYAINIIDGSLRWRYRTGALVLSSPIVYNNHIYIGGYDKILYSFDTSGRLDWKFNVNGLVNLAPVIYDLNKTIYPAASGSSMQ